MSFRARIFLISCCIVGTVLVVVMGLTWTQIVHDEVARMDERMCIEAKGLAALRPDGTNKANRTSDLALKLRLSSPEHLMVQVKSENHGVIFQAGNWPESIAWEKLNWSNTGPSRKNNNSGNQPNESCSLADFEHQTHQWRAALFTRSNMQSFIASDRAATTQDLRMAVQSAFVVVVPLALLLSAFAAWFLANFTMRPVHRLSQAMETVTQKELHHRLPDQGESREFKTLINAYNAMLARLERSFLQASRFSADAAHELRTPLTILRGELEQVVTNGQPDQLDLNSLLDEVGKLSSITRKLLLLSQADAGRLFIHLEPLDLNILLNEMIEDLDALPDGKQLVCRIGQMLRFEGDEMLTHQLFNNLISNAIRYSTPDAIIEIDAHVIDGTIEITIQNPCLPIHKHSRKQFFDRFFRGDPAHNSHTEGSGLGLSLAREIARAHNGDLVLMPSANNSVAFKLTLPSV